MTTAQEATAGRCSVHVVLTNQEDLYRAKAGRLDPSQVRRITIPALVDSGAARLVIPAAVAEKLGLELSDAVKVRYADSRTAIRPVARGIYLEYASRGDVFSAIVEPDRDTALIGAVVMEVLDLIVDCTSHRLVPRDPKQIIAEIE